MDELLLLLLLCCSLATAVKHSLRMGASVSSEHMNILSSQMSDYVDGVQMVFFNSSSLKGVEPRLDRLRQIREEDQEQWDRIYGNHAALERHVRRFIERVMQHCDQTEGFQTFQASWGCELDTETRGRNAFFRLSCDGDDFLTLDQQNLTWIAAAPQAEALKQQWDREFVPMRDIYLCVDVLREHMDNVGDFILTTAPPSVSLLQKTPSSPVRCHATGFFPPRAVMFWTRDGERLHDDVDHQGRILPNHDGTFQTSVDLNVSSVGAEDWSGYDCVFQLSGLKDDIITNLDRARIRTNMEAAGVRDDQEKASNASVAVISVLVPLAVVLIAVAGVLVSKHKKAKERPSPPEISCELSERLNPEP